MIVFDGPLEIWHMKNRRRQSAPIRWSVGWRTKCIAALVSTFIALLLCEILVWRLGSAPDVKPIEITSDLTVYERSTNPILGFELKANYRDDKADLKKSYPRTNAHGQRDVERSIDKPPGVKRIILLGDSVVEGMGVSEIDDTMSRQLEMLYEDGKTEVLNFAVSGYCTLAEVELLEVKGLQFDPDIVILVFVENDFDNFNRHAMQFDRAVYRPRVVKFLFYHSRIFRLACLNLNLFQFGAEQDPVRWNDEAIGENNVVQGLRRFKNLADQFGFEPLIMVWPNFSDDDIFYQMVMEGSDQLVIEGLGKTYGIPSVRLTEHFAHHRETVSGTISPRLHYTVGDGMHPSPAGCRVAALALEKILKVLPSLRQAALARAPFQLEQQNAVEAAYRLGQTKPDYSRIYNYQAIELESVGKMDEAMRLYRQAIESDPEFADGYYNLANLLFRNGQVKEAIPLYQRALEIYPYYAEAHVNLANLLSMQGKVGKAIEHLRQALQIRPGHASTYYNLANFLFSQNKLEEAVKNYELALNYQPDDAGSHHNLGITLRRLGRLDEAAKHLGRSVELRPEEAMVYKNLADVLTDLRNYDQAIRNYRHALEIQPDYPAARANLERVLQLK